MCIKNAEIFYFEPINIESPHHIFQKSNSALASLVQGASLMVLVRGFNTGKTDTQLRCMRKRVR